MTSHAAKYRFSEEMSLRFQKPSTFFSPPSSFSTYSCFVPFSCFLIYWKSMSGRAHSRLLKQCRTFFLDYERAGKKKLCEASTQISAETIREATDFFFFFSLFFFVFFLFKDFIQCHLYTTKSPIYYYISFFFFFFLKKEPHGAPQYCGSRRKK